MEEHADPQQQRSFNAKMGNIKGLTAALQAIKTQARQYCTLTFEPTGMTVRWEDDSKAVQSGVFLGAGLFREYTTDKKWVLGLPFSLFLDLINLFTSTGSSELILTYPGPNAELVLEAEQLGIGATGMACTYARINTVEMPRPMELSDWWEEPCSYFLLQGDLLKEAIEDCEWTGGDVEIIMQRDPACLKFYSQSSNSVEVEFPLEQLSGMSCAEPEIRYKYKMKFLRTALANIPSSRDAASVSTKVSIDKRGLMKVTHMLSLHVLGGERPEVSHPLASLDSQQPAPSTSKIGVVQFMLLPKDDHLEEQTLADDMDD